MELTPLKNEDLHRRVQTSLKEYFVASGMKAGDPIPTEMELASSLGISRTAIREGLKGLEALGIVEVRPGIGRFLRGFNFEAILDNLSYGIEMNVSDFRDILEVRIALESSFLVRDLEKFTTADIRGLSEIVDSMERLVAVNAEEKELIKVHTSFHLELYRHSANELLLNLIRIFATIQRNLTLINRYRTTNKTEFIAQHRRLIEAIEKRDPDLVRTQLLDHFAEAIMWSRGGGPAAQTNGEGR
ncbi:FadR/GntR family transcriptional regulator [Salinispira pacifica]